MIPLYKCRPELRERIERQMRVEDAAQKPRIVSPHATSSDFDGLSGTLSPSKAKNRIRQSNRPLLNKLETEFVSLLEKRYPGVQLYKQALRWRLGNGIWFKPDVAVFFNGLFKCYEVKGPHAFRGGFENLKVAAGLYPTVRWVLAWKEAGEWKEQIVLP